MYRECVWKVNMIDGSYFLIYSDERNIVKFTQDILPRNGVETISPFKCAKSYVAGDYYKYNSVVIVGSKVSSVEYYIDEEDSK
jgi:hypothetical protein